MARVLSGVQGFCDNVLRDGLNGAIGLFTGGALRKDLPVQYHLQASK